MIKPKNAQRPPQRRIPILLPAQLLHSGFHARARPARGNDRGDYTATESLSLSLAIINKDSEVGIQADNL
jgi:hypothetical protein